MFTDITFPWTFFHNVDNVSKIFVINLADWNVCMDVRIALNDGRKMYKRKTQIELITLNVYIFPMCALLWQC